MATFVALITETRQGETNIQETVDRAARFREEASEFGCSVKELYWTLGAYDGFVVFDAPDEETAASLLFKLTSIVSLLFFPTAFDMLENFLFAALRLGILAQRLRWESGLLSFMVEHY